MSDQSPPSPPAPRYPGGDDGRPPRKDTWKLWVGLIATLPFLVIGGGLVGLVGEVSSEAAGLLAVVGLLAPIGLLLKEKTLKFGLGLLIGYAVLLVIGAGTCVALIVSYSNQT